MERRLVSFVDYGDNNLLDTDVVLISIDDDLYVQYDTAKGYNIDSLSTANVLITQANDTMSISIAVANLTTGQSFKHKKLSDSSDPAVVVEVCNVEKGNDTFAYATINIYLDSGESLSSCQNYKNNTTAPITSPPTMKSLESIQPSTAISSVPSDLPSDIPTTLPSINTTSPMHSSSIPQQMLMDIPSISPESKAENVVVSPIDEPTVDDESSRAETSGQSCCGWYILTSHFSLKIIVTYVTILSVLSDK
jgi:hypothetical protein